MLTSVQVHIINAVVRARRYGSSLYWPGNCLALAVEFISVLALQDDDSIRKDHYDGGVVDYTYLVYNDPLLVWPSCYP